MQHLIDFTADPHPVLVANRLSFDQEINSETRRRRCQTVPLHKHKADHPTTSQLFLIFIAIEVLLHLAVAPIHHVVEVVTRLVVAIRPEVDLHREDPLRHKAILVEVGFRLI